MPNPKTTDRTKTVRRLRARWTIEATLESMSPIHLGSGDEGAYVDLELLRDRAEGLPLLTGASLAGALRDHLCERLAGDGIAEFDGTGPITRLFGGLPGDATGDQSSLIVLDALGVQETGEIRDGIRLDPETGIAARHAKYDMEVWPKGTRFAVRLDLLVPSRLSDREEVEQLALLAVALEGVSEGDIVIGAKGSRGFGECRMADIRATRWRLGADTEAWKRYLATGLRDAPAPANPTSTADGPTAALMGAWAEHASDIQKMIDEKRQATLADVLHVDVDVAFPAGLLMAGAGAGDAGADRRHIHSNGRPVTTGTGVGGALRHRARRIAAEVRHVGDAGAWVEDLFGSEAGRQPLVSSRLSVREGGVEGSIALQVTRIKLDRFTQAPVEGALLQEEPVYRGTTTLRFRLRLPTNRRRADALAGLFLLVLKDLLLGDLPLGGTVGVGRGAVEARQQGRLIVRRRNCPDGTWVMGQEPPKAVRQALDDWVAEYANHPVHPWHSAGEVANG